MKEKSIVHEKNHLFENFFNYLDILHQNRIINYIKPLKIETLIDVGAHKGEFASYMLKIKTVKKIFCFEPQLKVHAILSKKFKEIKKIKVFNYALEKKISKKLIYNNKLTSTSTLQKFNNKSFYLKIKNLLTFSKYNYVSKDIVKTNTIDNVFKKINLTNALLKIDVEGYEMNVLIGSKKKLKDKINYILIEHQFGNHYKNNSKLKINNFLNKNNFKVVKSFIYPTLHFKDVLYKKEYKVLNKKT
jgi:hypothetical protein